MPGLQSPDSKCGMIEIVGRDRRPPRRRRPAAVCPCDLRSVKGEQAARRTRAHKQRGRGEVGTERKERDRELRMSEPEVDAEEARVERAAQLDATAEQPQKETEAEAEAAAEAETEKEAEVAGPQGAIGVELGTDKCVVAASSVRRAATAVLVRNEVSNEAT